MKSFKDLRVWQHAIKLVKEIYNAVEKLPDDEKYGLVTQMRRSAISIPSNIAEGHVRQTVREFRQFIAVARGSCAELQTQVIIAYELGYIEKSLYDSLLLNIESVAKMLSSLYGKL